MNVRNVQIIFCFCPKEKAGKCTQPTFPSDLLSPPWAYSVEIQAERNRKGYLKTWKLLIWNIFHWKYLKIFNRENKDTKYCLTHFVSCKSQNKRIQESNLLFFLLYSLETIDLKFKCFPLSLLNLHSSFQLLLCSMYSFSTVRTQCADSFTSMNSKV